MSNSSIWPKDRALSVAYTPGKSGTGSDSNEFVLPIPQISNINEVSPSDYLVSNPGHSFGESYSSAELQSVYSSATDD